MFERRLKIVLIMLLVVAAALVMRAASIQIIYHSYWNELAEKSLEVPHPVETTRGNIFDCKNRELALDVPCTDACVQYPFLTDPPDPKAVLICARARLT